MRRVCRVHRVRKWPLALASYGAALSTRHGSRVASIDNGDREYVALCGHNVDRVRRGLPGISV